MLREHDLADLIARIECGGSHRVLRKLQIDAGRTAVQYRGDETFIAAVVDVETTGLDPADDVIIELAVRRFRFDGQGRILKVDRAWSWLEDPGRSLDSEITRLTGLTDAGLVGQHIDDAAVLRLIGSAHIVIAHNAGFDRKFVDKRFPDLASAAWACTCAEVDWAGAGFEGRALGWLVAQAGMFFDAHRASSDVDAVVALLSHGLPDGRTILAELIENSSTPTMRIEAIGADFGVKDRLRRRGYRWDANLKTWWREVRPDALADEEEWLSNNIYGVDCRARSIGPRVTEMTARERFA